MNHYYRNAVDLVYQHFCTAE